MEVTAVFDIGKTNKKFFLFDKNYQEVFKSYQQFEEIEDEDGFPCDNVAALKKWVITTFQEALGNPNFEIKAVNCSAYGASFVHLDKRGEIITPLYNYLKPFPADLLDAFYKKYGNQLQLATETASPPLGMLNSGLQLYWLKHRKSDFYERVRWSLHLPQYLSYLLSGVPLSEYTSIGCHTMLWDYQQKDYHAWVYAEGIDKILAPIVTTDLSINRRFGHESIKVGSGIHDSSAALLPYKMISNQPFLTLSTGTWSITLNPFNQEPLKSEELTQDCLNFLSTDGKMVKAASLFLFN
ncbi:MAG: FGGY family carbohydrate kinase [Bacteroidota bacterium]